MDYLEVLYLLCAVITFLPDYCNTELADNVETTGLPAVILSDLDLSNADTSTGNVKALRKVKRLASEKNEETGQPGVDYPALTRIPGTSFSCRGLKGGYYADLETNCQVFHICDNGRKISFLCPNGTIFQQSQLICDWWFKVDCSKSAEFYEESSKQLAEEERKRVELKKSKTEYHRTVGSSDLQDYQDEKNHNYDGKQNGRINPFDERLQPNQLQPSREKVKPGRQFDARNIFGDESNNRKSNSEFHESGSNNGFQVNERPSKSEKNSSHKQRFNQLNSDYDDPSANKHPTTIQNYYDTSKKTQTYRGSGRNLNASHDDKIALKRLQYKASSRSNSTTPTTTSQRVTPTYTESTTFRESNTNTIKESQQFAESAAFVSNRRNRYNENSGNSHNFYYQLYSNRDSRPRDSDRETTTLTSNEQNNDDVTSTPKNYFSSYTTTTLNPDETTIQYTTTTIIPCNTDDTATDTEPTLPLSTRDTQTTTESFPFSKDNNDRRGGVRNTAESRNPTSRTNYHRNNDNRNSKAVTDAYSNPVSFLTTIRARSNTENYRQNSVTTRNMDDETTTERYTTNAMMTSTPSFHDDNSRPSSGNLLSTASINDQYDEVGVTSKIINNAPSTVSQQAYRQNLISTSTGKPTQSAQIYQHTGSAEKDLSPYDRSFTYKQGKVMSTLSPYIPFTRNYAYTTTSTMPTPKPTPYTVTVPTYRSSSTKGLIPRLKQHSPSALNKLKANTADPSEREHALSMLHSLRGLENKVPGLADLPKDNERVPKIIATSGPSTLHSLALYFSTATDNFDTNVTTDSAVSIEYQENKENLVTAKDNTETVEVPTSILTQHTISSYAELFKLNNALESNNATNEDRFDAGNVYGEDYNDDLDIQQSGGSLDDVKEGNGTKLRELAQVFTHALSAYLLDPGTFKKVLTEIRPTEPSLTSLEDEYWKSTTPYTVMDEDYTAVIREKDEVLDFSDNSNELALQKLTTIYPTTDQTPRTVKNGVYRDLGTQPTTYYADPTTEGQDTYEPNTKSFSENLVTGSYFGSTVPSANKSQQYKQSRGSDASNSTNNYNRNSEFSTSNVRSQVEKNYFSSDEVTNRNRVGGFQNNSAAPVTPSYGRVVTASPFNWSRKSTSRKPEQQLTPPFFESYVSAYNRESSESVSTGGPSASASRQKIRATTFNPNKFYDTSTDSRSHNIRHSKAKPSKQDAGGESLVAERTGYAKLRSNYNRIGTHDAKWTGEPVTTTTETSTRVTDPVTIDTNNAITVPYVVTAVQNSTTLADEKETGTTSVINNDHWTSSPAVTQLWETSVFVDPKRINYGLESEPTPANNLNTVDFSTTELSERLERSSTMSLREEKETFTTTEEPTQSFANNPDPSTTRQRLTNDDSPTAFTLLPSNLSLDNVATPKPIITTRSSVTTTFTSSVTSTNSISTENLSSSPLPFSTAAVRLNGTEKEVAEKLFGNLNATSTNTLMNVMKQADNNETVRQLVLLLISHCADPMNSTMQQKKDELLDALLRMPVNEFASDESKNIVVGINKLNLPTGRSRFVASDGSSRFRTTSMSPTVAKSSTSSPPNKKNRKFRTSTEIFDNPVTRSAKSVTSEEKKSLSEDETLLSDNRALELLRSLYTIATKWG